MSMSSSTLETTVAADGSLVVSAEDLSRVGARPGDRVRLEPILGRRRRSLMGYGRRPIGFTDESLAELRAAMGAELGDDLES